jgi:hypothetical protein
MTTQRPPDDTVTVTPEPTTRGPVLDALFPDSTVYEAVTVAAFTKMPLLAVTALDCMSPVLGLYSSLALLV